MIGFTGVAGAGGMLLGCLATLRFFEFVEWFTSED